SNRAEHDPRHDVHPAPPPSAAGFEPPTATGIRQARWAELSRPGAPRDHYGMGTRHNNHLTARTAGREPGGSIRSLSDDQEADGDGDSMMTGLSSDGLLSDGLVSEGLSRPSTPGLLPESEGVQAMAAAAARTSTASNRFMMRVLLWGF